MAASRWVTSAMPPSIARPGAAATGFPGGRGGRRASPSPLLPLRPEQREQELVAPPALEPDVPYEAPLPPEPEPLEQGRRRAVLGVGRRRDPVLPEVPEHVPEYGPHRLGRVAAALV